MYDAVILGSGPGGNAAAEQIALRGGRACIVEQAKLGGTCVNTGCMPTKAMLAGSALRRGALRADRYGLRMTPGTVDGRAFLQRARDIAAELQQSIREKLQGTDGIDIRHGRGRLLDAHTVRVESDDGVQILQGRCIVLAVGSVPNRPSFLPWDSPRVWTSEDAIAAEDLPGRVLVLGGGPLGCEFATLYGELGVRTTLVEMTDRLLPKLDPAVSPLLMESFEDVGVEIALGRAVNTVDETDDGLAVTLEDGRTFHVEVLLAAAGRTAALEGIGLETVGLERRDGLLRVDEQCRTDVEGIFAVGDTAEYRNHSHLAMRMGIVAGDAVMGLPTRDDRRAIPVGVYTHPEVACVGACDDAPDDRSDELREWFLSYEHSGTAFAKGRTRGFVKVLADDAGGIHGGTWAGPHAVDLIHELVLAIRHNLTLNDLYETTHAHPGYQEMLHTLAEQWRHEQWEKDHAVSS